MRRCGLAAVGREDDAADVAFRAQALMQRDLTIKALGVTLPGMDVPPTSPWTKKNRVALERLAHALFEV
jgi:hypothetical protein